MLRDIRQVGERLAEQGTMWRVRDDVMPGLRTVAVHRYLICFRVTDTTMEIGRVIHGRRNLPAIFGKRERRT
jgi:plasmid stabilization system protein ParE